MQVVPGRRNDRAVASTHPAVEQCQNRRSTPGAHVSRPAVSPQNGPKPENLHFTSTDAAGREPAACKILCRKTEFYATFRGPDCGTPLWLCKTSTFCACMALPGRRRPLAWTFCTGSGTPWRAAAVDIWPRPPPCAVNTARPAAAPPSNAAHNSEEPHAPVLSRRSNARCYRGGCWQDDGPAGCARKERCGAAWRVPAVPGPARLRRSGIGLAPLCCTGPLPTPPLPTAT